MKRIMVLMACAVLTVFCSLTVQATGSDYVIDYNGERISTPKTHIVKTVITDLGGNGGIMLEPQDIFIDESDNVYIADSGNNRIVVLDKDGQYLRSYSGEGSLYNPQGVYVSRFGSIFVADTGNQRIANIDTDDRVVESFVKPESDMLEKSSDFAVRKVYLSNQGFLYTIKGQQFMMLDAQNDFKGFVGANSISFNLKKLLIRVFATEEQKLHMETEEAPPYNNFMIGNNGMVYAVASTDTAKIKKLNVVGKNVFPTDFVTEKIYDANGKAVDANFVDIAVDDKNVISVLEQTTGRIYQYDDDGNLLSVFGGLGDKRGYFKNPVSIAVNSAGEIYVLDANTGYLHIFTPTKFMSRIKNAIWLYSNGEYEEAYNEWTLVSQIDVNYPLANRGIGQTLYKMGKPKEAMAYFEIAKDREHFGAAFNKYRYDFIKDNFLLVVLSGIALTAVLIFLIVLICRIAKKTVHDYYFEAKGK